MYALLDEMIPGGILWQLISLIIHSEERGSLLGTLLRGRGVTGEVRRVDGLRRRGVVEAFEQA